MVKVARFSCVIKECRMYAERAVVSAGQSHDRIGSALYNGINYQLRMGA